jgi:hypothetical protein
MPSTEEVPIDMRLEEVLPRQQKAPVSRGKGPILCGCRDFCPALTGRTSAG